MAMIKSAFSWAIFAIFLLMVTTCTADERPNQAGGEGKVTSSALKCGEPCDPNDPANQGPVCATKGANEGDVKEYDNICSLKATMCRGVKGGQPTQVQCYTRSRCDAQEVAALDKKELTCLLTEKAAGYFGSSLENFNKVFKELLQKQAAAVAGGPDGPGK